VFGSALFVFCSKRSDKLKALYWDSSSFSHGINDWKKRFK